MNIQLRALAARHPAARHGAAPALSNLSLGIAAGEHVAVIGPSGAGKTTMLQVLACALPPSQGEFLLNNTPPWSLPAAALRQLRGTLFLAPQVPPLPPRQRVVTSVLAGRLPAMGLLQSLRSLFYPADIPAAYDALDQFDLAEKLFERVDRLSGGERQRVGLARTLLAPAKLWLIDEPLSALDPARARQALETLLDAARDRQTTVVATLHQVDMALAHFPRIIGLRDGALVFDLPSQAVSREVLAKLYDQYEHELRGDVLIDAEVNYPDRPAPVPAVMHCR